VKVGSGTQSVVMDSPDLDQRILRKAETALQNRTSRLIVVIERCTNDHNYSAILRTTEALGIHHVYIISPKSIKSTLKLGTDGLDPKSLEEDDNLPIENAKLFRSTGQKVKNSTPEEIQDRASHHLFAKKALEWLNVREFDTTKECIDVLRKDGFKIWSTDLSQVAVTLTPEGLSEGNLSNEPLIPEKLAIVFGTEAVGCSTEILEASDKRVYLPLRGFADSLNLSVATALVVHHLFILDPSLIGAMSEDERIEIRRKWYAKLASQRLLPKAEKSKRKRLNNQVRTISEYEKRMNDPNHNLTPEQLEKIKLLP
jgi:tRNA(Leu) C34 or U34 (ribose-2'-O)-methylase TrmL